MAVATQQALDRVAVLVTSRFHAYAPWRLALLPTGLDSFVPGAGYFLGGDRLLRSDLAEAAIKAAIAEPLGLSVPEAAAAIHDVVNAKMAGAVDVMFSKRGCDPRDFTLIAAGGAAPVHAARLAREIGMKHFIVPRVAPVFCAFGMMYADLKHNYTRPYSAITEAADLERVNALFAEMEAEARGTLEREGAAPQDISIERSMDIHYYGQVREQNAAVPDGPVTAGAIRRTSGLLDLFA